MSRVLAIGFPRGLAEVFAAGYEWTAVVGPAWWRRADRSSDAIDRFRCVGDGSDTEQVLLALTRSGDRLRDFDAVVSFEERGVMTSAILATLAGARGLAYTTAVAMRDKAVQKRRVQAAGIPTADHMVLTAVPGERPTLAHNACRQEPWRRSDRPLRLNRASDALVPPSRTFPAVVKPVAGVGGERTMIVRSEAALMEYLHEASLLHSDSTYLLESYVDGPEIHIDGVVSEGTIMVFTVSEYHPPVLKSGPRKPLSSITLDTERHRDLYRRVAPFATAVLGALGHRTGIFHMEAFDQETRLVFGECAARPGGAFVTEAFFLKTGVNLLQAHLDVVTEAPLGPTRMTSQAVGWTFLPPVPPERAPRARQADCERLPGVQQVIVEDADTLSDDTESGNAPWRLALVQAQDEHELRRRLTSTVAMFSGDWSPGAQSGS